MFDVSRGFSRVHLAGPRAPRGTGLIEKWLRRFAAAVRTRVVGRLEDRADAGLQGEEATAEECVFL